MANNSSELEILDLDDLLSESDSEKENTTIQEAVPEKKETAPAKSAPANNAKSVSKSPVKPDSGAKEQRDAAKPASKDGTSVPVKSTDEASADTPEIEYIDMASPDAKQAESGRTDRQSQTAPQRPARVRSGEQRKPSLRQGQERPGRQGHTAPRRPMPKHSEDEKPPFPLHLALLAAIVVLAVVAVIRFLVWNKGVELKVRIGENTDKYIIEVNDNMVYLSDSKLEGHEDDGVTTILCLGNEPFSQDTSESGLAGQIASLGSCNVINAAFPGSQVTCENAKYSTDSLDSMDDIFNLFYVSYAISIGDFSSLETVASAHTEDSAYQQSVDALKNTDFSKVDVIAIMYDGTDYINGMAMQNPDVPDELTTYVGSLSNSFKLLQDKYPYIRIVFMSPYYAEYDGVSSRTTDLGNGTIVNYFQWAYDTCGSSSVSFLDNYYGSVNENNYKDYLSDDVHLNTAGCTKVADHFVYKVIQDNYAEYNVSSMAVAQGS